MLQVCDDKHSELIPCLDRNLIYQMRLKLDLNLMEHYERHCPQPERRYNCLIPPPKGYKVFAYLLGKFHMCHLEPQIIKYLHKNMRNEEIHLEVGWLISKEGRRGL